MTEFAIYLSGDHGTLLVDGKPTPLFGALVACDIRRLAPPLEYSGQSSSPANIIRDHPVAEVTLRLPLDTGDHLTLMRDGLPRDIDGPTGDTVATEANDAFRAKVKGWLEDADTWDEWPTIMAAILGILDATAIADEVDANEQRRGYGPQPTMYGRPLPARWGSRRTVAEWHSSGLADILAAVAVVLWLLWLALFVRNVRDTVRRRRRTRAEHQAQDGRLRINQDGAIDGETARKEIRRG